IQHSYYNFIIRTFNEKNNLQTDTYLRKNSLPNLDEYDSRSVNTPKGDQMINIIQPTQDQYFIGVYCKGDVICDYSISLNLFVCRNNCSNQGTCNPTNNTICDCNEGYTLDSCSRCK